MRAPHRRAAGWPAAFVLGLVGLAIVGLAPGCDLENPGRPLPPGLLNFPIATALAGTPDGSGALPFLIVANSNFDLRYASGSLQAYAIDAIDAMIADPSRCVVPPGAPHATYCAVLDADLATAVQGREVAIGSAMDGLTLSSRGDRIYLPARSGVGGLTWIDFDPASGGLACGQDQSAVPRCDPAHGQTDTTIASSLGLTLPSDPVAVEVVSSQTLGLTDAAAAFDFHVMGHRNGNASLFVDDHTPGSRSQPRYVHTLGSLPNDMVSVRADLRGHVWLTSGAVVAARQTRDLVSLGIVPGEVAGAPSARLAIFSRHAVLGVDDGLDSRDMVFDRSQPADAPPRLWLLTRRPEAILTVDFALPAFTTTEAPLGPAFPVGFGPSRLSRYEATGSTLLLASCFDARALFVVDPDIGTVATIPGMVGPFEMAVDEARQRVYVVDFRFSVLWVIDLAPLLTGGSPGIVARLGTGHAPSVFR